MNGFRCSTGLPIKALPSSLIARVAWVYNYAPGWSGYENFPIGSPGFSRRTCRPMAGLPGRWEKFIVTSWEQVPHDRTDQRYEIERRDPRFGTWVYMNLHANMHG